MVRTLPVGPAVGFAAGSGAGAPVKSNRAHRALAASVPAKANLPAPNRRAGSCRSSFAATIGQSSRTSLGVGTVFHAAAKERSAAAAFAQELQVSTWAAIWAATPAIS